MQQEAVRHTARYRPDIDGLRAIAVLFVVLDHLHFRHFEGGYIGVDVFFVISGYLIGSSMLADFRDGVFSFAGFFERRVRRIAPALLAMLLVTSLLAYHYLMPHSLVMYAYSLLAALGSVSNILFWGQSGYFDTQSGMKPLLHTWSLGVEEQFYIVSPFVLFLLMRWLRSRVRLALWVLAVASFVLAVWAVRTNPPTAFFLFPFRAWELLLGVMVSQYGLRLMQARWAREAGALLGLGSIAYAGLFYTSATHFPGVAALVPCGGVALLIAAGQVGPTITGAALSLWPLRFIGLISYSLYLWHWPVVVFQNTSLMVSTRPTWERGTKDAMFVAAFVLAVLSWWLIETPFRKGRWRPTRRTLFVVSGVAAVCVAGFGVWLVRVQGAPWRISPEIQRVAAFEDYDHTAALRQGSCFLDEGDTFRDYKPELCLNMEEGRRNFLIYGDSTAAALYWALAKSFPEIHFQQATAAACRPPRDYDGQPLFEANCLALERYLREEYLPQHRPDAVVLAAGWGAKDLAPLGEEIAGLQRQGIHVILVGPFMAFDRYLPLLLAGEMQRHQTAGERTSDFDRHLLADGAQMDAELSRRARDQWHVGYISYYRNLCGKGIGTATPGWEMSNGCPLLMSNGDPLMFDNIHLTLQAGMEFAEGIRKGGQFAPAK